MPDDLIPYRRTAEFNERTIPQTLRRDHSTKPDVWAKIQVIEGKLNYRIDSLGAQFELSPGAPGIVIPEVPHHVEPVGSVRVFVEFYKRGDSDSDVDT
jgi:tellurite methyltransferase